MHSNSLILKTSRTFHFSSLQRAHFKYHFYVLHQRTVTSAHHNFCTFPALHFFFLMCTSCNHFLQSPHMTLLHISQRALQFLDFSSTSVFFSCALHAIIFFTQSLNMTLLHISQRALQYTTISGLFQHFSLLLMCTSCNHFLQSPNTISVLFQHLVLFNFWNFMHFHPRTSVHNMHSIFLKRAQFTSNNFWNLCTSITLLKYLHYTSTMRFGTWSYDEQ